MNEKSVITTQRAAEMLGVSVSSIYRMEKNDILHPIRTQGGQRRFDLEEIENYKKNSVNIVAPQKPYQEDKEKRKEIDKRNTLNDLNGTEWLPETKSFFIKKGWVQNIPMRKLNDSIRLHIPFRILNI